jgi:alginate O-acetyltransferase complex protein AlgI
MLFASAVFLLVFLPIVIVCYYTQRAVFGNRIRNGVLLASSYLFYAWGAADFVLILLVSTVTDYLLGLLIEKQRRYSRWWVAVSIIINLGVLAYLKYANFMVGELSRWLTVMGLTTFDHWVAVALPIGISFFTFQKLSYIIDIHRRQVSALTRFVDFALYVAMFPQLVAGPIVRFKDICTQLSHRMESWDRFYMGAVRFCWGLSKKVFIADACGQVADAAFGLDVSMLDTKTAWLGAFAYTMQIYFDFSAYSDMAIGLARLFGFELRENFNRPYAAVSMTDFWRRWHISLSTWFRDYLYIPLGGNRKGSTRTAFHLLLVFLLCGLWHGANWTFIAWGLYHGLFLGIERTTGIKKWSRQRWAVLRRLVTFLLVLFGWVLFRADSITAAAEFIRTMVVPLDLPLSFDLFQALNHRNILFLLIAAAATLGAPWLPNIERIIEDAGPLRSVVSALVLLVLLPYCAGTILAGAGNPFIYFRF